MKPPRAFTLIELVVVSALCTITVSIFAIHAGRIHQSTQIDRAVNDWLQFDAQARLLTLGADALVALSLREHNAPANHHQFIIIDLSSDEVLARRMHSKDVEIRLYINEFMNSDKVVFDRSGCSSDYRAIFNAAGQRRLLEFAGLTGHAHIHQGEGEP